METFSFASCDNMKRLFQKMSCTFHVSFHSQKNRDRSNCVTKLYVYFPLLILQTISTHTNARAHKQFVCHRVCVCEASATDITAIIWRSWICLLSFPEIILCSIWIMTGDRRAIRLARTPDRTVSTKGSASLPGAGVLWPYLYLTPFRRLDTHFLLHWR